MSPASKLTAQSWSGCGRATPCGGTRRVGRSSSSRKSSRRFWAPATSRDNAGKPQLLKAAAATARRWLPRDAALLQFAQALIVVFSLNGDAIVEALEFAREAGQRFVGLLQLGIEMLYHYVRRRGNLLADSGRRSGKFAVQRVARGGDFVAG